MSLSIHTKKRALSAAVIGLAAALGLGFSLTATAHAAPGGAAGHDATSGADFVYDPADTDAGATITKLPADSSGNLVFPSTVDTGGPNGLLTVAGIGNSYAQFKESYGKVVIPDSVTAISAATFRSAQIGVLQLGSGITVIGQDTFEGSGISAVEFSPGLIEIGTWGFHSNNLSSIELPESLTSIGYAAFVGNKLTEVTVPDQVTEVSGFSFADNQISRVTFGKSVQVLGYGVLDENAGPIRAIFNGPAPAEIAGNDEKGASLGYDENTLVLYQPEHGNTSGGFTSPRWKGYRSFPSYVNVTFDSHGGSPVASAVVPFDDELALPQAPTKAGSVFTGWFLDQGLQAPFDASNMQRSADFTLFAGWKADGTVKPDPEGNGGTKPPKTGTLPNTGGSPAQFTAIPAAAALLIAAGTVVLIRRKLIGAK